MPNVYPPEMALGYVWSSFSRLREMWDLQMPDSLIDNEITILDRRIKMLKLSMEHARQNLLRDALLTLREMMMEEKDEG